MQIGSGRIRLAVAGATIVWLVTVAMVIGGTGESTRAAAFTHAGPSAAAGPLTQPSCGGEETMRAAVQAQAAAAPQQMAGTAFKNVQILKNIPVDEFMGAMGLFSAAVSMCCLECHAPDWAADTPRKITTRKMINMVNTINQANFNGRK